MNLLKKDLILNNIIRRVPQVIDKVFDLEVESKSHYTDIVTQADKAVEAYITGALKENFPQANILGEESWNEEKTYSTDELFVIDPIDGTTNFVKQGQDFCTIVTYFKDGQAQLSYIYNIKEDIMYRLIRDEGFFINGLKQDPPENIGLKDAIASIDIKRLLDWDLTKRIIKGCFAPRILGSAGLEGARLATGKIGLYANNSGGPWDFSAYFLISKELGLYFADLDGNPLDPTKKSSFIMCTPAIAKDLGYMK